jgi:glycerol kinase
VFTPRMDEETAAGYYKQWLRAVERSEKWECEDEKDFQTC